jgi:YVTN family beta-propeller protein
LTGPSLTLAAAETQTGVPETSDLKLMRELYGIVACSTSDSYTRFDLATYATDTDVSVLPEGDYPYDATMNPAGTEIWIPGASGDGVVVVDRATGLITQRILAGEYVVSVAFSADGGLALVAGRDSETIEVIDTATYLVINSLPVPTTYLGAGNIALDPSSGRFYCVDWYGDDLYEIAPDGSAILDQVIDLGSSLWQLVVSPDGQFLYITDRGTDEVRVIDRAALTQIDSYPVGDDPWGIDITANGEKLVVACEDSHEAFIIETATGIITPLLLDATADPRDVDILDADGLAFVVGGRVGTTSNPVFVLDLATNAVATSFEATCTNTNVIAVQPQMHEPPTAVGEDTGASNTPAAAILHPVYPNPFNPLTNVRFELKRAGQVRVAVYDLAGRHVRTLVEATLAAAVHERQWDGRDIAGRAVPSGAYYVRLESDSGTAIQRMTLLK